MQHFTEKEEWMHEERKSRRHAYTAADLVEV